MRKTYNQPDTAEEGPSGSVESNQPTESTTPRVSDRGRKDQDNSDNRYNHGGQSFGGQPGSA